MTYREFLEYIKIPDFSPEKSVSIFETSLSIYLGAYRREPFCSGFFRDEDREGGWYYYSHPLGAISEAPVGEKLSEEECVERLKWDYDHCDERREEWKRGCSSTKFAEWANAANLDLLELGIYPDSYTNRPFASGCYRGENGEWYVYIDNDERAGVEPCGRPCSESEAFYLLTCAAICAIQNNS